MFSFLPTLSNTILSFIHTWSPLFLTNLVLKTFRKHLMYVKDKILIRYVAGGGTNGGSIEEYYSDTDSWRSKSYIPTFGD